MKTAHNSKSIIQPHGQTTTSLSVDPAPDLRQNTTQPDANQAIT
ncbi:hypothetical protein HMPREF0971_01286 [Segatella oris F0302]|uniref:Uncharacterized protein n=1 Tax=Segatella oris F0302 TaxID=649760 RepID=D1QQN5_9BACT|nr:hypothetical protein HMPREF0971_01286 [Segatella oris F0302]